MKGTRGIICSVLISGLLLLASCASFSSDLESAQATTTPPADIPNAILPFRITWKEYSGRGEAIRLIIDAYNSTREDGFNVSVLGGDEDQATVEQMLVDQPDTVFVLPYRFVQYFGDRGLLMDLTTDFEQDSQSFYPEVWSLGTVDDSLFGIPWLGHTMCLLYNRDLLDEAGVDPSSITDTESFAAALAAVTENTESFGIGLVGAESNDVSWMVNQFIYGFGSSLVDATGTQVTINNDKSAQALHYYKDTLAAYSQPTWMDDTGTEVMEYFREGKIAFEIQGIWGVTDIEKNGAPFPVGVLPMSNIGMRSEVGPMMVVIPAGMQESLVPDAVDLIRYLISKPAQEQIMNGEYSPEHDTFYPFRIPIRKDMSDTAYFTAHPEYAVFIDEFSNPSVDVPVPAWQTVKETIYQKGLHQVMTEEMTVEEFLAMVEEEGTPLLSSEAS